MESLTLTFSGDASVLESHFSPEIQLNPNYEYVCGLVDFQTYNSIPNIDKTNNKFYYYPRDVSLKQLEGESDDDNDDGKLVNKQWKRQANQQSQSL